MTRRHQLAAALLAAALAACAQTPAPASPPPAVPAAVSSAPLAPPAQPCEGRFAQIALPHTTRIPGPPFEVFDGNGSGMALGDLDGDGRTDIVLGNIDGPNTIFWNLGDMRFRPQSFGGDPAGGGTRAVAIVDADGDGRQDIVVAQRYAKPQLWRNTGDPDPQRRFAPQDLPGVNNPAYAIDWADLDGDGRLDLIAGSYDTELAKHEGPVFAQRGGGVGVFVYWRRGDTFVGERLAKQADALALAVIDVDGDGRKDIVVGNDFNRPDDVFLRRDGGWEHAEPFSQTTENTMSLDVGDIDNTGSPAIFAADMKPYHRDTATMARWLPMMKRMTKPLTADDPQQPENTLQQRGADGRWRNIAYDRMVDASGWSWSSKFGDLDGDGFLDLYSVNGMIARGLFDHLPGEELVEQNMVFRNDGHGGFQPEPGWGLGLTASGRGMSMADMDGDGRLDIVVNNLGSPAVVLQNRLCGGAALEVDLRQPGTGNVTAIGATLRLVTSRGTYTRDVRSVSGYLSGDSPRVHFGVPAGARLERLEVRWPDGAVTEVPAPTIQTLVTLTR